MPDETLDRLSATDILSICDLYRCEDYISSLDRAELSRHFGGGALHEDPASSGLVGNNNWLQGYKYLNRAYRQIFSIATSSAGLIEVNVKRAQTPQRRRHVENTVNWAINEVLRRSRRFRFNYGAACGDAILYGSPYLYRWNKHDWIPTYAGIPLMPRGAPADVNDDEFVRWAFAGTLSARNIVEQLKHSNTGKKGRWNRKGLSDALVALKNEMNPNKDGAQDQRLDELDPERLEYAIQADAVGQKVLNAALKVYYFFQKRPDGKIDISIINRNGEAATTSDRALRINRNSKEMKGKEQELFYQAARFDNVNECLWPMILDVKFGGKPAAHRVQGLGRLNYDLDYAVSELLNSGIAGLNDDFTPLYQATDNASLRKLEEMIQAGVRRGSVFPGSIQAFPKDKNTRNYGNLLSIMNVMDIGQSANAASHALGSSGGKGARELEVQAIERQQTNAQDITSRMEDWTDMGLPMTIEMIKTITSRPIQRGDRAWIDRKLLIELLGERGVSIEEVHIDNLNVRMRKHLGAGDNALALQRAEKKVQNLHLLPAESHPIVIREWVAAVDDSWERALEIIPEAQPLDQTQIESANAEEALALSSGQPPEIKGTTIAGIHVPRHLDRVGAMLQQNQETGLDQALINGISALLEHAAAETKMIEIIGNKPMAEQFMQAIYGLAKSAEAMARPTPPPKEEVELQLKVQNQQLQEQRHADSEAKNQRKQQHREEIDQTSIALKMDDAARKNRALELDEDRAAAEIAQG